MAETELIYNELKTTIKCNENDKFEDIAINFVKKRIFTKIIFALFMKVILLKIIKHLKIWLIQKTKKEK